ncbi:hypothetical protein, partial [Actinomadura bangladeshensis]
APPRPAPPFAPQAPPAPRGAETVEHGGSATGAMALALLCLPAILFMIFKGADLMRHQHSVDGFAVMLLVNMLIAMAEGTVLGAGALLLLRRRAAGRWMIAGAGGAAALHGAAAVVQFFMTGGTLTNVGPSVLVMMVVVSPALAVCGAGAVVMALRPATGRWCLPRTGPPPVPRGAFRG